MILVIYTLYTSVTTSVPKTSSLKVKQLFQINSLTFKFDKNFTK